jgi:hypothetical protein
LGLLLGDTQIESLLQLPLSRTGEAERTAMEGVDGFILDDDLWKREVGL